MSKGFARPVIQEKKIKVQANDDMHWFGFVHFKGLNIHQYRKLKIGEVIEINKSIYEFNKRFLKEVK